MDVLITSYYQTIRQNFLGWFRPSANERSIMARDWPGNVAPWPYSQKGRTHFEYNITIHVCICKKGSPWSLFFKKKSIFNSIFLSRWCMEPSLSETLSLLLPFNAGPWLLMTPSWTGSPTHLTPLCWVPISCRVRGSESWKSEGAKSARTSCSFRASGAFPGAIMNVQDCFSEELLLIWLSLYCQINATRFLIVNILSD